MDSDEASAGYTAPEPEFPSPPTPPPAAVASTSSEDKEVMEPGSVSDAESFHSGDEDFDAQAEDVSPDLGPETSEAVPSGGSAPEASAVDDDVVPVSQHAVGGDGEGSVVGGAGGGLGDVSEGAGGTPAATVDAAAENPSVEERYAVLVGGGGGTGPGTTMVSKSGEEEYVAPQDSDVSSRLEEGPADGVLGSGDEGSVVDVVSAGLGPSSGASGDVAKKGVFPESSIPEEADPVDSTEAVEGDGGSTGVPNEAAVAGTEGATATEPVEVVEAAEAASNVPVGGAGSGESDQSPEHLASSSVTSASESSELKEDPSQVPNVGASVSSELKEDSCQVANDGASESSELKEDSGEVANVGAVHKDSAPVIPETSASDMDALTRSMDVDGNAESLGSGNEKPSVEPVQVTAVLKTYSDDVTPNSNSDCGGGGSTKDTELLDSVSKDYSTLGTDSGVTVNQYDSDISYSASTSELESKADDSTPYVVPDDKMKQNGASDEVSRDLDENFSPTNKDCKVMVDVSQITGSEQKTDVNEVVAETEEKELLDSTLAVDNGHIHFVPEIEPDASATHITGDEEGRDRTEGGGDDEYEEAVRPEGPAKIAILESSETAKQFLKDMEDGSSATSFGSSLEISHQMDGQIVSDSDEEVETDEEGDGKELFDSASLAALLRAASSASSDGNITITASDAARIFSIDRPAGLGSSVPSLNPGRARPPRSNLFAPSELAVVGDPESIMNEEEKKMHDKVDQIRVKFLRIVHRLGHSPDDTVAAQVLYRLWLAEGIKCDRQTNRAFSIESAKKKALQLEENGNEHLEFSCNILVLGKSGVGKSSIINSIFGEQVTQINAFQPATTSVKEVSGVVDGVKICFIDTPGLRPSLMDQSFNKKILSSIKKYMKKFPPDIVLYVDRLDTQTRDFNDLPLLRSIASTLGSSIWFNAVVALTHAASAPPDGPNGAPLSYDVFVAQRSHIVQHSIRQAAGDMRLMNRVALVENHPSCRRNREGQRVLPNGITWRPQLLLLCYSSKTLSEANSLLKLQDFAPGKLFGFRVRSPPLPYLLSSLLQSRAHPKLATVQGGENADSDIELDMSDSDQEEEEEEEYDQLPPFKPLKKSQITMLTKEQRRAYFDEYDYRVKLFQKKQLKEEVKRLKEMKKRGKAGQDQATDYGDMADDYDQDGAPAAVPVPLPDMVLPPTFDCDNPAFRYRFLEPTSQLLARPVLDTHGWDHDCGYDGVSLEENLAIAGRFPTGIAVQITKDKEEFNIHLDSSISAKHEDNGSTLTGFDIQSVGKQLAYILRSETKFKNLKKKNNTTAGISVTFLGENVATGLKLEDQVQIGKRLGLVGSTGFVRAQGDVAYGANLEARLREKDFPIGQDVSTLGLSLMKWHGDLALGANLQSQFSVGRNSKMAVRVGLNNKLSGQITVRTSTSDQLQIALLGIVPIALSIYRSIWPGGEDY